MKTVLRFLNRHIHRVGITTVLGVGIGVIVGLSYAPVDWDKAWVAPTFIAASTLISFVAGVGVVYFLGWLSPDKTIPSHRESTP